MKIRATVVAITVSLTTLAACGGGSKSASTIPLEPTTNEDVNALVASYDLAAGAPQRFIVGLVTNDQQLISFGTARLTFAFLGGSGPPEAGPAVTATWIPIPGQHLGTAPTHPKVVDGSEGIGVYRAPNVRFDRPGNWQVNVEVRVGGKTRHAEGAFAVLAKHGVVAVGDRAPLTDNPLPGAPGVPPKAIDSRVHEGEDVPDTLLHNITVREAIASGKPTMVVVSTPVYCVSRFCGPITDAVEALAKTYGDRMNFVHLEVWRDFDSTVLNKAAAEWIDPSGSADAWEPWVWVVGRDGLITDRFDNVATEDELGDAVTRAIG